MTPEQIRTIRANRNQTQAQFAGDLGVTRFHVLRLENGKRRPGKTLLKFLETMAHTTQ